VGGLVGRLDLISPGVSGLEIVEQARVGGLPAEPLAGQRAGGRLVDGEYHAEHAEVLRWDLLGREAQLPTDCLRDRFIASPSSPTAWEIVPGASCSSTSRNSLAASSRSTAGQRWLPSPT
jgi:hypothetical protein